MTEPRLLGGRYEIGPLLGYGGMAEVHRGRDLRLDRDVAVKVLRSDLARDPTFQARFRREAQAAAALNHPSIVAVYDTGDGDGTSTSTPYIVMEYVEGQTLRDLLKARRVLDPTQAMQITADICAALDFSHRSGIVHRDVKPGNVMITNAGRVKVMDFGIARAVSDTAATMTATAAVIGTVQYLAPEQARGENVDARSDVYAVGCVLYELVTGTPPFVGDSPVAVAYQHVRENPKQPSSVNPSIPPALDAIILKAMSKNPANRYQSAAEMQQDLLRAIDGRPVQATPVMSEQDATTVIGSVPPPSGLPDRGRHSVADDPLPSLDDEDDDDRKRMGAWAYALLAVAAIAIIVAAFIVVPKLTASDEPTVTQVDVPTLTGMTAAEATSALQSAGLNIGTTKQGTSTIEEKDTVIGQDPQPKTKVAKDSKVNLTIGAGPSTKTVPIIVGSTQESAKSVLDAAGLGSSFQTQDNAAPAGQVIDSSPKQGTSVVEGSTVTVFISSGTLPLPDVTGKDAATATKALNDAGFANVQQVDQVDGNYTAGTVISQNPAGGGQAKVAPTNLITITVAQAPPVTTTSAPPSSSAASSSSSAAAPGGG